MVKVSTNISCFLFILPGLLCSIIPRSELKGESDLVKVDFAKAMRMGSILAIRAKAVQKGAPLERREGGPGFDEEPSRVFPSKETANGVPIVDLNDIGLLCSIIPRSELKGESYLAKAEAIRAKAVQKGAPLERREGGRGFDEEPSHVFPSKETANGVPVVDLNDYLDEARNATPKFSTDNDAAVLIYNYDDLPIRANSASTTLPEEPAILTTLPKGPAKTPDEGMTAAAATTTTKVTTRTSTDDGEGGGKAAAADDGDNDHVYKRDDTLRRSYFLKMALAVVISSLTLYSVLHVIFKYVRVAPDEKFCRSYTQNCDIYGRLTDTMN